MMRRKPQHALAACEALLVDLDGVVTRTAAVHAAAWKELFDRYLQRRAEQLGSRFEPFDIERDYRTFVDGKPRYDGVQSFLESRGISIPHGSPDDPPDRETVCGLGNRKNEYFNRRLEQDGVDVYQDAVAVIRAAREDGLKVAVVSSSENCEAVLRAAGLSDLFDARVDGIDLARMGLAGKPAPDMFLEAARRLGVTPGRAAVLEDAVSGVEAGRRGGFGLVVGVDRGGQEDELRAHGAHIVLTNLEELVAPERPYPASALERIDEIRRRLAARDPAIFLDYDGTLTPIVDRPDLAVLSASVRETVRELASLCPVAVVSGRDRADVARLVGLDSLIYAGSHGFDITGPGGFAMQHEEGTRYVPFLKHAEAELRGEIGDTPGVLIEPKAYALAIHYRLVSEGHFPPVREAVDAVAERHPELRKTAGKKVYELRPRLEWDKGKAVLWLLQVLGLDRPDVLPFYLGDDVTDEDAFAALEGRGIGILVGAPPAGWSQARYGLADPRNVERFLRELIDGLRHRTPRGATRRP